MEDEDGYLLDNRRAEAGVRFGAMAELFDGWTFRHLEEIGVGPGWRCWEAGAGWPTVPEWLAERVGAAGRVLATDIDVSWLGSAADAGVVVRHHDLARDRPPAETFDLVHARLVLVHLPGRAAALRSMISTLRPGGICFIQDADPALQPLACPDEYGPEQVRANRIRDGFRALLAGRGVDLGYGRTLPRLLREAGLTDIHADAYFPISSQAGAVLEAATINQLRDMLIEHHHATETDITDHLAAIAAGHLDLTTAPLISAWGRRPDADGQETTQACVHDRRT